MNFLIAFLYILLNVFSNNPKKMLINSPLAREGRDCSGRLAGHVFAAAHVLQNTVTNSQCRTRKPSAGFSRDIRLLSLVTINFMCLFMHLDWNSTLFFYFVITSRQWKVFAFKSVGGRREHRGTSSTTMWSSFMSYWAVTHRSFTSDLSPKEPASPLLRCTESLVLTKTAAL